MAHAVSNATQVPKIAEAQAAQNVQAPKPPAKNAAPEDKVTISDAGRAAQQSGGNK